MKHTTNAGPWTDAENAANVALYFWMIDAVTAQSRFNKAALIRIARNLQKQSDLGYTNVAGFANQLKNRSRGSIEAKLMNCSAAHRDIDPAAITMHSHGYRALSNYQASLRDAMYFAMQQRDAGGYCGHEQQLTCSQ